MTSTEPRPVGGRTVNRLMRILAERGLDPDAALPETVPEPLPALRAAAVRIPARYRAAVADHPQVADWVRNVATSGRRGPDGMPGLARGGSLLIVGGTGSGKTHQVYGAVRSLLAAGVRLRWEAITAPDLYGQLRPRPGQDPERELAALARVPLLILDDLGAGKSSEWTEEITYRLINRRYIDEAPTLITTNLPIGELRAQVGDRVASRLAEMTDRVILTASDRRRQSAA